MPISDYEGGRQPWGGRALLGRLRALSGRLGQFPRGRRLALIALSNVVVGVAAIAVLHHVVARHPSGVPTGRPAPLLASGAASTTTPTPATTTTPTPTTTTSPPSTEAPPTTALPPAPAPAPSPSVDPAPVTAPPASSPPSPPPAVTPAPAQSQSYHLDARSLAADNPDGSVSATITAFATADDAPDPGVDVSFSGCGSASAVTGSDGRATAHLSCPASSLPATVTVSSARGISFQLTVTR